MRLASEYYAFYMICLTGYYTERALGIKDIVGNSQKGLFSNLSVNNPEFAQKELETMMESDVQASKGQSL
jgi:hypothetical protein